MTRPSAPYSLTYLGARACPVDTEAGFPPLVDPLLQQLRRDASLRDRARRPRPSDLGGPPSTSTATHNSPPHLHRRATGHPTFTARVTIEPRSGRAPGSYASHHRVATAGSSTPAGTPTFADVAEHFQVLGFGFSTRTTDLPAPAGGSLPE
ncbi:hypothetical protein HBB16_10515 [Pseudonocardia sp. MCCB 268]|nr:hypothetical protein [Pseudonocardia cytotoxica]